MSLVSVRVIRFGWSIQQHTLAVVDSDFGETEVKTPAGSAWTCQALAVVKFYSERNLSVGKNLARMVIYEYKDYGTRPEYITRWQDEYCKTHIPLWKQYARDRDLELQKLLPLL